MHPSLAVVLGLLFVFAVCIHAHDKSYPATIGLPPGLVGPLGPDRPHETIRAVLADRLKQPLIGRAECAAQIRLPGLLWAGLRKPSGKCQRFVNHT